MSPQPPGVGTILLRGLQRRCPRCGERGLFRRWFEMSQRCSRCDLPFERSEGYWLGAMAVNLGVTEALFGALFVLAVVLTWPDVPWFALTVAGVALNVVVPIVFYPFSKTIFLAFDVLMHRWDPHMRHDFDESRQSPRRGTQNVE